ncbi:MAG: histidinol-phosphatase [Acutalibacteraceae bacterium]|jgi:histidinol-phosphatase (PHP family)
MIRADYHLHTAFSDGANTPEEMVKAALQKGMRRIGFSDHAHTPFDESYCMKPSDTDRYKQTIAQLRKEYRGRIEVLCGIEQDLYSDTPTDGYDFVIGSVHYLRVDGEYLPVDESPAILADGVRRRFDGDWYALCEAYYDAVGQVVEKTGAAVIGHFDLITKFNEGGRLFDECHPRYAAAYRRALERLLPGGAVFEINTGAISRGWRTAAYPAPEILREIALGGGKVIMSSDAHSAAAVGFGFETAAALASSCGLTPVDAL